MSSRHGHDASISAEGNATQRIQRYSSSCRAAAPCRVLYMHGLKQTGCMRTNAVLHLADLSHFCIFSGFEIPTFSFSTGRRPFILLACRSEIDMNFPDFPDTGAREVRTLHVSVLTQPLLASFYSSGHVQATFHVALRSVTRIEHSIRLT